MIETKLDIVAAHSVNAPGVVTSWVIIAPPPAADAPMPCTPPQPGLLLWTAEVSEQITIFDAPIHAEAPNWTLGGNYLVGSKSDPVGGSATTFLLPNTPPSLVPCMLNGPTVGLDGSWDLYPGEELTTCTRLTLTADHDVTLVRVVNGPDAVESMLTFGAPRGPDTTEICSAGDDAENLLGRVKGAATIEAKPRDVRILAGQQLILRVQSANATTQPINGTATARLF
jgi:hypothetical protein